MADQGTKQIEIGIELHRRAKIAAAEEGITLPERDGDYTLDLPGATPTSNDVIHLTVGESGEIDVIHSSGDVYTVEIPADWFWLKGEWEIPVGPYVGCRPVQTESVVIP